MKIRPISESSLCEQVRYNPDVAGTHICIMNGEPKKEKRDYSLYVLLSLMAQRGLFRKKEDESSKEAILRTEKEANDIVSQFTIQNNVRM